MDYIEQWAKEYGIDAVFGGYTDSLRFGVAGVCKGKKHNDPWRSRYAIIYINHKLEDKSSEKEVAWHEFAHALEWVKDGTMGNHGKRWAEYYHWKYTDLQRIIWSFIAFVQML